MKMKNLSMMLVFASIVGFSSCSNEEDVYIPQEVELTLDYTFAESGSLSRATGADVYNDFYEKHIKTKELTPKTYYLEFKDVSNDATILSINGEWGTTSGIRLPEGEYNVVGYSRPCESYAEQPTYLPSDTAYIVFNEKVSIVKDMTTLTLTAKYDSYLLLFDYGNISKIEINVGPKQLSNDGSCYWLFVKEDSWSNWDNGFQFNHNLGADIIRNNGDNINVVFGRLPLEIGKYYYFNDMTNSFDIPKMESGN